MGGHMELDLFSEAGGGNLLRLRSHCTHSY